MNKKNYNPKESEQEIEIVTDELETEHDIKVLNDCWHISVHPRDEEDAGKLNPQPQIKKLNTIGKIKRFEIIDGQNKDISYRGYEIDFKCVKTKNEIEMFFNSLRDYYKIRILPPNSNISDYIELIDDLSDKNRRIGEILKEIGSLTESELNEVLIIQKELLNDRSSKTGLTPIGELLIKERIVQESVVAAALKKQEKMKNIGSN
jgi:two-component system, chemotaxis family, sensor kinase CheA